ncbi:MAG: hypothetical protein QXH99_05120 [Sulfolobales archaeon]|jgi:hypothetical protein
MLNYVWVIPNIITISSIPARDDVNDIISLFKCVIALVEEFKFNEYTYDPEVLRGKCSGLPHTYT